MGAVFNLGRLFGIKFGIHFSWFFIFLLVTFSLVYPDYDQWLFWLAGIVTSLLFFASIVAHELAHSLVGRANGVPVESITLFIFGGVARMTGEISHAAAELKMALAGPVCSLIIGIFFGIIWLFVPDLSPAMLMLVSSLAMMNLAVAAFNLVPGFPLDGGRVLRSVLWSFTGNYNIATRIAARLGQGIGYLFIFGGMLVLFSSLFRISWFNTTWFDGTWFIFIGWFLLSAASASYRDARREPSRFSQTGTAPPDYPAMPPGDAR